VRVVIEDPGQQPTRHARQLRPIQGVNALAGQARRNHSAFERTQHVTTNIFIDLDGDRATVRAKR
jgi:hypothetical protein